MRQLRRQVFISGHQSTTGTHVVVFQKVLASKTSPDRVSYFQGLDYKEVEVLVRGVGKVAGSPRERPGRAGEGRGGGPVPRAASLTEW